jgi:hypothetical protein
VEVMEGLCVAVNCVLSVFHCIVNITVNDNRAVCRSWDGEPIIEVSLIPSVADTIVSLSVMGEKGRVVTLPDDVLQDEWSEVSSLDFSTTANCTTNLGGAKPSTCVVG